MTDQRSHVEFLKRELEAAQRALTESKQASAQLVRAKSEAEARLEKTVADLQEARNELHAIARSLTEVYASLSWRITAPVRAFSRLLSLRQSFLLVARGVSRLRHGRVANLSHALRRITQRQTLKIEYKRKNLHTEVDRFVLYRIIGNDLHPRHQKGQSRENVRFILENEPILENCEKRWVVNRIIDTQEEAAIISLLEEHGQTYLRIPFDIEEYRHIPWDFECFPEGFFLRDASLVLSEYDQARAKVRACRHKNNYVINNNGARNAALREGRSLAKWILPWDGNCFVTKAGWTELVNSVLKQPHFKYFIVPMARITNNRELLDPGFLPAATEEPQVIFRRDAAEKFNEAVPYGRRPKIELFWRLGIPGDWDRWYDDSWDLPRPKRSLEAGQFARAGWVARLFSGRKDLEVSSKSSLKGRGLARIEAITSTIQRLDEKALLSNFDPMGLTAYDEEAIDGLGKSSGYAPETWLLVQLGKVADDAISRGPYSVIDKTSLPPSGDVQDYWHPAPYWWPNPNSADGLPYIRRDGERVPGTQLFDAQSEKYDRTRLQRLFYDTTVLALAWKATGKAHYAEHAASLVRRWFIAPESRMNPHLRYAQVICGYDGNEGQSSGVIEMKDMYFLLDAIRLLCRAQALKEEERIEFSKWLRAYLDWLLSSRQGKRERQAKNNHGTCYDLQVAAIATFLGDIKVLTATFRDSQERLLEHFAADGSQPHELERTQTAHYVCFNLQSWANLALLAQRCGCDLWDVSTQDGRGLRRGFEWIAPFVAGAEWTRPQSEPFDVERYWPLYFAAIDHYKAFGEFEGVAPPSRVTVKPLYFPHDGIKPFWMLESPLSSETQHSARGNAAEEHHAASMET